MGFAYEIRTPKIAPLASTVSGFSVSASGPLNARNICQTTTKNNSAQAVYWIME